MESLLALLLAGAAATAFAWIQRRRWQEAAARLGLRFEPGFLMLGPRIRGTCESFWVCLYHRGEEGYRVEVDCSATTPGLITLGAENLFIRTMAPDFLTGDAPFDFRARVTGSEECCLAVLDHETRRLVLKLVVDGGARVESGKVVVAKNTLAGAETAVPELVELARRVSLGPNQVVERLARNAIEDPLPEVRLRSLRVLQDRFPGSDETHRAWRQALASDHPALRLEGAIHLADDGFDTLAELALKTAAGEDLRVRAVDGLTRASWSERALPVLERLLEPGGLGSIRAQRAAIEAVGRFRHRPALRRLEVLADAADALTAEAIADTAGRIGDAAAESILIRLLEYGDSRVQAAAVRALGRVGTVSAVEPLLELTRGLLATRSRQAAREAVARIQSRLGTGDRGGLSVAQPAEQDGALSTFDDGGERGALSLEETDDDSGSR